MSETVMRFGRKRDAIFVASLFLAMAGCFGLLQNPAVALAAPDSSEQANTTNNTFTVPINGYFETCVDNAAIYKKSATGGWEKVSTDLPAKGLYYLDDGFVGYRMCDVVVCTKLSTPYTVTLVEYEKVGEKTPPTNSGSTANALPVYKTVPLAGAIKIEVDYFGDKDCRNRKTFSTLIQR